MSATMTREDIIQLARECGFSVGIGSPALPKFTALIEKALAEEREACALVCESRHANGNRAYTHPDECAAAIRARKDNT